MKQGEIVILNFPFTDLSQTKTRPALIISNDSFNKHRNIMLIAISTQKGSSNYYLSLKQNNLEKGSLNKSSFIRLQNIFVAEKRLIKNIVAKISDTFLNKVQSNLISFIK